MTKARSFGTAESCLNRQAPASIDVRRAVTRSSTGSSPFATLPPVVACGAEYDASERYRYTLWRDYAAPSERLLWIMLNPSTATAEVNDPTVRRCQTFGLTWGFTSIHVVNIFALRSTDPANLYREVDPVGPDNNYWISREIADAALIVCAWGSHGRLNARADTVRTMLIGREAWCFALTAAGQPVHPLYQLATSPLVRFV